MHQTPSLAPWLDHLHALLPPQTVTVVGAGNGGDTWVQWLAAYPLAHATLVEAHALPFAALQRLQDAGQLPHATLLHAVVAEGDGEASFFTASLTAESGLLPPESLRPLWPGIHTVSEQSQPTIALGTLLNATTQQHGGPQWLLLDCLPAAALLRSAQAQLPQVDVVLARVLCAADHAPTLCGMGADLENVANALPGFQLLALQPSRHPALGHALFVRDYRHAAQHASQARDAEAQAKQVAQQAQASLQAQLLHAQAENANLLKKQELQAQAQQALQADLTKTIQTRDAEAQAKQTAQQALADLQQRLEQAQADNANLLKKQELQAQAQQALQADLTKTIQARDAEAQAKQAAQQALAELQKRLEQAQADNANLLEKQELQAQAQQALQADLKKKNQEHEAEAKNNQIAQHANVELQRKLEKLQIELSERQYTQELLKKQLELTEVIEKSIATKDDINSLLKQLIAFIGLENYWETGELPTVNTEKHAWPVSPDFSLYMVSLLEQNDYDMVIEFGSGVSTVITAKVLRKMEQRCNNGRTVQFVSFDHLPEFYQQTLGMLKQTNLDNFVQLHHTPLENWQADNGDIYPYYACREIFKEISKQYKDKNIRILVVVDGPPGSTAPHARYPAVPLVLKFFPTAEVDILLDDYIRKEEKEISALWQEYLLSKQREINLSERKLHKDACFIKSKLNSPS